VQAADAIGVDLKVGNLLSSDTFYDVSESTLRWGKLGVLAVEMEAATLYANAAYFGKRALAICSITDHVITGENLPSDERRKGLNKMIRIALDVACAIG
jgi:purine-nucleoside phosphorylase